MPNTTVLLVLVAAAAMLIAVGSWVVFSKRLSSADREKRRRLAVNAAGRLTAGNVTEADEMGIFYSYSVGGVEYATSQDIAELRNAIGVRPEQLIGRVVTVKYAKQNPADSIVVCEKWSGLRSGVTGGNHDSQ